MISSSGIRNYIELSKEPHHGESERLDILCPRDFQRAGSRWTETSSIMMMLLAQVVSHYSGRSLHQSYPVFAIHYDCNSDAPCLIYMIQKTYLDSQWVPSMGHTPIMCSCFTGH